MIPLPPDDLPLSGAMHAQSVCPGNPRSVMACLCQEVQMLMPCWARSSWCGPRGTRGSSGEARTCTSTPPSASWMPSSASRQRRAPCQISRLCISQHLQGI